MHGKARSLARPAAPLAACDQEVAGSIPGLARLRSDSGQVVHIHLPLSPTSIYRCKSWGGIEYLLKKHVKNVHATELKAVGIEMAQKVK